MTPGRRLHVTFWLLVLVTTAAAGLVSRAVTWPAGPAAGLAVAASGLIGFVAGGLALRILIVMGRGHR